VHSQAVTTLIRDDENGYTFDPQQSGSIGRALDRFVGIASPRLSAIRDACRQCVRTRTPARSAEQLIDAMRHARRIQTRRANVPTRLQRHAAPATDNGSGQ